MGSPPDGTTMQGWSFATYAIAAMVAIVVVMIVIGLVRARKTKRPAAQRRLPSSSVDPFYLDSSHAGEPRTQDGPSR